MNKNQFSRRSFLKGTTMAGAAVAASTLFPFSAKSETLSIPNKWDMDTDVVIAGGGVAGCMAAIEIANAGYKVLLLQADINIGGNSGISSGWIRSVNTQWHKKRGIKDSVEAYVKDGIDYGQGTRNPEKMRVIAEKSSAFVDTLINYGVTFTDDEDRINGGEKLRIVKAQGGGAALMKKVREQVSKNKNIILYTEAKILDVYKTITPDTIQGAKAEIDEEEINIKCKAVILATGGFGRNQQLIEKYTNEWKNTLRIMDLQDKGEGLLIATSHGAGSANLHIAMVVSTMAVQNKVFYSTAPLLGGGIIVNQDGNRFVNELVTYTDTPRAVMKQKKTYMILSEGMHPQMEKMIKDGVLIKASSIEELAKNTGADVTNLKSHIDEHNKNTREKVKADRFGRTGFGKELKAPFYSMDMWPVMIETTGGIFINEKSEITNFRDEPVMKGFYGAGAVAFGEHFGMGYRSGDAYVYAGVTGMVAGEEIVKYIKNKA